MTEDKERLGALEDIIRPNIRGLLLFICLFLLLGAGGFYIFFLPNPLLDGEWQNNQVYVFFGASIVAGSLIIALMYVKKIISAEIRIYERALVIHTGLSRLRLWRKDIYRLEWQRRAGVKMRLSAAHDLLFIHVVSRVEPLQLDTLTFRDLESKTARISIGRGSGGEGR